MATCGDCQHELEKLELEELERTLTGISGEELVAPPPDLVRRVTSAFFRKQVRLAQRPARRATLEFDSWTRMAPLGVRGTPQERQLFFSEGTFDLDLQVAQDSTSKTFVLRGQILNSAPQPEGLEGIEFCLTDAAGIERRGLTDQLGRFSCSRLAKGTFSFKVLLDDHDIVFDPVLIADSWTG